MKQKDIALILVVVIISAVASIFISKSIFASPKTRQQKVEVVQPITADFLDTDKDKDFKRHFNDKAFDPTKNITIEQNANTDPFNGVSQ